ncbi:dnase I-like superfamily protein, partial [Trifolium medium]|nr:dnase I-like superfamily protein [Trifolium medium]
MMFESGFRTTYLQLFCKKTEYAWSPRKDIEYHCYDQFGVSRKGPQDTTDEHCTIFYDKEKVELLEGGTFWLSESPSVPGSISWGSEV